MSAPGEITRVSDQNVGELLAAEWGVLILTLTTCGACAAYEAELEARVGNGEVDGVALGVLPLDVPGAARFKRANPWIADLEFLPHTVIYRRGEPVQEFATSRSAYLLEQVDAARARAARPSPASFPSSFTTPSVTPIRRLV